MNYNQKDIELKWQRKWQELGIYKFDAASTKPVYSIDVPPRYASGALHVGHAMHYIHIDFVARFHRMLGYNVLVPLCFDINGMPIEVNVEKKHNIRMKEMPRKKFVELCKEFAQSNVESMKKQFVALGTSFDSSVYYQTDEEYYRRLTQISFIRLYKKGLIYKGKFPVNYCPRCHTALAHAEIEYSTRTTKLNYIKFAIKGSNEHAIIATTRPELLPACQLICINPKDESKHYLANKKIIVPLFEKEVSVQADEAVDPNFGTGTVMVCTIGDKDDLKLVYKYSLPLEIVIDDDGKLKVDKYKGLTISEARNAIIEDLRVRNLLVKQEDLEQNVGTCWRCHTPTEIIVKEQFFLKTLDFKERVLKAAEEMKWYPEFMKQRLRDWVSVLVWDWVISRQRYFATPIPVWECKNCRNIVLAREEDCYVDPLVDKPPVDRCTHCNSEELVGCEEVFDTWMDSSVTPLYNSFWEREQKLFDRIYPMSLRPQAHEIIRTWLFYTILRSLLLTGKPPFKEVMIDGFMMGPDNRPMHTSWGNVVDPMEMTKKYSADAFRYFSALCALGQDSVFREKDIVHGTRFCKKFWNIQKFINQIISSEKQQQLETVASELKVIDKWILSKYSELLEKVTNYMREFKFDCALKELEYFAWHEFADHYIELVKSRSYRKAPEAVFTLYTIGLGLAKLLAPFIPHLAEEVYELNYKSFEKKISIHTETLPEIVLKDATAVEKGEFIKTIVSAIRAWKVAHKIPLSEELGMVEIATEKPEVIEECREDLVNTIRAKELSVRKELRGEKGELLILEGAKILISKHL
ncbi:MAG: valine--tRNA ligase [Candidatus Thermoplasmatota archaeon]|nr:valine--tRNA ligase [Candidatus Thermoplasmatota archaeon]